MKIWERVLFFLEEMKKGLAKRRKKAWSGLSILAFREDHAGPPLRFRINYYVFFFLTVILVSVPVAGLTLFVQRQMQVGTKDLIEERKVLYGNLKLVTEEKLFLLQLVQNQVDDLQEVSGVLDRSLVEQRLQSITEQPSDPLDPLGRDLAHAAGLRKKLNFVLEGMGYYAIHPVWNRMSLHQMMPRGRPLKPGYDAITSDFGHRKDPFKSGKGEFHAGIDFASAPHSPLIATAPGRVIRAVKEDRSGFGLHVKIHHGYGYVTLFGHCSEVLVEEGQWVDRGTVVARLGRSGRATGYHIHYEVHLGDQPTNPMQYVRLK